MAKPPRLWVVAGPNGAGKTTLVSRRLAHRVPVINADEIAAALPKLASGALDELEADRRAIAERERALAVRASFAVETTLSGNGAVRFMQAAKARGYQVTLIYVGIDTADLSQMRVGVRVASGGHAVPVEAIYRRYPDTMARLPRALELADRAYVFDNTGQARRFVLSRAGGQVRKIAAELPRWARAAIPEALRTGGRSTGVE